MSKKQTLLEVLLVIAIFAIALAVRTYRLDEFPPGLYNDEAAYGMDGLAVLRGEHAVFFERNNGREPLFIYLLALVFNFLGATPYTVRLTAALIGAATVVTTYWMVRATFRFAPDDQVVPSRWFAAWVALFLAFSYWHLSFSRLGFRAITLPLVITIAFALLWMTWRRLRQPGGAPWVLAIATGVALGLTLYTYTAGRMAFALFFATVLVTVIVAPRFALARRRILATVGIVFGFAVLTVTPLLLYFVLNPAYFAEHAAEVSIFNPKYSGGDPIGAFVNSLTKTMLMFFNTPDRNPRHNPAQIPVFDPLLAIWLAFGLLVATITWRKLTTSFSVIWFVLFIAPAILSGEGIPHSLRTIGLLPIVYVLPLMGIAWVVALMPNHVQRVMRWLPAPFLAVAAFVSLTSYFGAWDEPDRFRPAFFVDFVDLAHAIDHPDTPQGLWVLPLPATEELADGKLNTIDFLLKKTENYTTLRLEETATPRDLNALAAPHRQVFVLQTMGLPEHRRFQTKFADTRGLLDLLLRRNSLGAGVTGGTLTGIPYTVYTLVDEPHFALPAAKQTIDAEFGDLIRLNTANIGASNDEIMAANGVLRLHADDPLWAVLHWQANAPITTTLKTSLTLTDEAGDLVAQRDEVLGGERFPLATEWHTGEEGSTFHLLEMPPALAPGRYMLVLRVYADESGQIYYVQTETGETPSLLLAIVDILPPRTPGAAVTPAVEIGGALATDDFAVFGYDLPSTTLAPGTTLPLTLYLRASMTPTVDYTLSLTLRDANGDIVDERQIGGGGGAFPTSTWRAGETIRIPANWQIEPTLANGEYTLNVTIVSAGATVAHNDLATIKISGRHRQMQPLVATIPVTTTFDKAVQLIGANAPAGISIKAGNALNLDLIWQPLEMEARTLIRFVQLLDSDGRLTAQQDIIPCNTECPASSWLAGEFLTDPVTLNLSPELKPGDYYLIIGWYDADTQQRLAAIDANDAPLPDNVIRLPVVIHLTK